MSSALPNGAGAQLRAAHAAGCHSGGRPTSALPNRLPAGPEPRRPRCGGASAAAPCWAALRPLGVLEPPAPRGELSRRRRGCDLRSSAGTSTPPAPRRPRTPAKECPRAQPMSAVPGSEPGRTASTVGTSPTVSCARERRRQRSEGGRFPTRSRSRVRDTAARQAPNSREEMPVTSWRLRPVVEAEWERARRRAHRRSQGEGDPALQAAQRTRRSAARRP
jgi:hypothetical protein